MSRRDSRCAGRVVLEVNVAITSGSSQAFRSVDHHIKNCAQALRERPASGDGLGVRAFHYSTEPHRSITYKIGARYRLQAHVPVEAFQLVTQHTAWRRRMAFGRQLIGCNFL